MATTPKKRTSNRAKPGQKKPNIRALDAAAHTAGTRDDAAILNVPLSSNEAANALKERFRRWTRPLASACSSALTKLHFSMPDPTPLDSISGAEAKVAFVAGGGADSAIEFGGRWAVESCKRWEMSNQLADTEMAEMVTECDALIAKLRAEYAAVRAAADAFNAANAPR